MKPKIIYSDEFLESLSIFINIAAISLFPFVIIRKYYQKGILEIKGREIINHETIHFQQQLELGILPFYVWYILEFLIKLFANNFNTDLAYRNISFEREAYNNESNLEYLNSRKRYNWIKLIK